MIEEDVGRASGDESRPLRLERGRIFRVGTEAILRVAVVRRWHLARCFAECEVVANRDLETIDRKRVEIDGLPRPLVLRIRVRT
jgi:hypothetical protein